MPNPDPAIEQHLEVCDACLSRVRRIQFETNGTPSRSEFGTHSSAGQAEPTPNSDGIQLTRQPEPTTQTTFSGGLSPDAEHTTAREDRFQPIRFHAEGNLGRVWLVKDLELNREVALKEIQKRLANDPASHVQFLTEAKITGGLEHPGIVPVYALGRDTAGQPYYAMRFIRGKSLLEAIDDFYHKHARNWPEAFVKSTHGQKLPPAEIAGTAFRTVEFHKILARFVSVCNAIAYAHTRGVIHRDLKPANIMLGKYGETLVVDWGLALATGESDDQLASQGPIRFPHDDGQESESRVAVGTPAYMSPEQTGRVEWEFSPQTDVYLLGATLYHLITGRAPHSAKTMRALLENILAGDFPAPRMVCPRCPRELEAICLKAMAAAPTERYGSALELAADMERYLADEKITARPDSWLARCRRWFRKRPEVTSSTISAVLIALVSLGVGFAVVRRTNRELNNSQTDLRRINTKLETANLELARQQKIVGIIIEVLKSLAHDDEQVKTKFVERIKKIARELDTESGDRKLTAQTLREIGEALKILGEPKEAAPLLADAAVTVMKHRREATESGQLDPAKEPEPENLPGALTSEVLAPAKPMSSNLFVAQELLRRTEKQFGTNDPWTILAVIQLATAYRDEGELEQAQALYHVALDRFGPPGERSNDFYVQYGPLNLRTQIAVAQIGCRDFEAASTSVKRLRDYNNDYTLAGMVTRRMGYAREALRKVATAYVKAERPELAVEVLHDALKESERIFGKDDPGTVIIRKELSDVEALVRP